MRENVRVLVDIKDIINKKIRRWEIEHAGKILEQKLVNPEVLQWSLIINLRRKNKSLTIYKKRTISVVLWLLVRYVSLTDRSHTKFRSYPISNRCARIGKELFSSFNVPTCRGTGAPQPPSWTDASLVVATTQQQHRGRMTQQMNRGRTSRYQLNWPQTDRPAVLHRELWASDSISSAHWYGMLGIHEYLTVMKRPTLLGRTSPSTSSWKSAGMGGCSVRTVISMLYF